MKTYLLLFLLISVCFVGAQTKFSSTAKTVTNNSDRKLESLQAELSDVKKQVSELKSRVDFFDLMLQRKQDRRDEVYLDVASKDFQKLDTSNGILFVSVEDVSPYLDGYKVSLDIGNPSNATLNNCSIKVEWGTEFDWSKYTEASYKEWQNTLHQKEVSFTDSLLRGAWNKEELFITPATAAELKYFKLSVLSKGLSLSTR